MQNISSRKVRKFISENSHNRETGYFNLSLKYLFEREEWIRAAIKILVLETL
jgi:hypothetical protein